MLLASFFFFALSSLTVCGQQMCNIFEWYRTLRIRKVARTNFTFSRRMTCFKTTEANPSCVGWVWQPCSLPALVLLCWTMHRRFDFCFLPQSLLLLTRKFNFFFTKSSTWLRMFCVICTQISLKNLQNESKRKISLPFNQATYMFNATIGHVLVRTVDSLYLFELEGRKVICCSSINPSLSFMKKMCATFSHWFLSLRSWTSSTLWRATQSNTYSGRKTTNLLRCSRNFWSTFVTTNWMNYVWLMKQAASRVLCGILRAFWYTRQPRTSSIVCAMVRSTITAAAYWCCCRFHQLYST